ncbi:MAG: hypothetical protein C4524_07380 [Candidatus Zixiibacteriota bacterium]|nr:MAG: hypothetical protein C4524_07380 [candidate division Zixibacteria bacterium]
MKVLHARRTADDQLMRMERAYFDAANGRTCCCWEAGSRERLEELFQRAEVHYESMTPVTEIIEADLQDTPAPVSR